MNKEVRIFIGGSADGRRIEVSGPGERWTTAQDVPTEYVRDYDMMRMEPVQMRQETYREVVLCAGGSATTVMVTEAVLAGHPSDDWAEVVFHMLVNGYGRQPQPQPRDEWTDYYPKGELQRLQIDWGETMIIPFEVTGEERELIQRQIEDRLTRERTPIPIPFPKLRKPGPNSNEAPRSYKGDKR